MNHHIPTSGLLMNELEFSTSRSGGPGGQNVNKVETKVTLRWNVNNSIVLTQEEKEILLQKLASKLTSDGDLIISSQEKRSQLDNKEAALIKLDQLLKQAFQKEKKRKPTKPSKGAVQNRLDKKKKHSDKKRSRRERF